MQNAFDKEVAFRTAVVSAAVAYLVGPKVGLPAEVATPLGGALGYAMDAGIYRLKIWLKKAVFEQ